MRAGQLYCIVFQRVFTLLGRFFFNFIECWMKAERFFCCFLSAGLERISLRKIPRRARASWGRGINLRTVELGSDWLPCFAAILRRLISVRLAAIYSGNYHSFCRNPYIWRLHLGRLCVRHPQIYGRGCRSSLVGRGVVEQACRACLHCGSWICMLHVDLFF